MTKCFPLNIEKIPLAWDFGDGSTVTGTLIPTHIYAEDGSYSVTLTVTDTTGLSGANSLNVTVIDVAKSTIWLPYICSRYDSVDVTVINVAPDRGSRVGRGCR